MNTITYYLKPTCRMILLLVFATSTISITLTWTSFISAFCLFLSYVLFKSKPVKPQTRPNVITDWDMGNPFKGKTGGKHGVDQDKDKEFHSALSHYLLYDASDTKSVQHFQVMKKQSDCVFAKRSQVWGSPDYDENISLEENIKSLYPTFLKFISCIQHQGLDAFVFELPGHLFGSDIKVFGDAVRRTLRTLKTCDNIRKYHKIKSLDDTPTTTTATTTTTTTTATTITSSPQHTENTNKWSRRSWVFEIHATTFFITTFAPFYPPTNSRYNFELPDCYILFQPEISFAIHDLPRDTPVTNWRRPVTVRDRIRKAFQEAGREYTPPMVEEEPMVCDMVKRIEPGDAQITWWMDGDKS